MSENNTRDFEERYSACVVDFGIKTGAGFVIGAMMSSFFLKNRKWPIVLGSGVGFGMAYINCENSLNDYLRSTSPKACNIKAAFCCLDFLPRGDRPRQAMMAYRFTEI